jgi:hypothetical protein
MHRSTPLQYTVSSHCMSVVHVDAASLRAVSDPASVAASGTETGLPHAAA